MKEESEKELKIREQKLNKRGSIILFLLISFCFLTPVLFTLYKIKSFIVIDNVVISISLSLLMSVIAFFITFRMIPTFMKLNIEKEIYGVDINKVEDITNLNDPDRKIIPESLGIVPATVFLVVSIISQTILNLSESRHVEYNASLLSICFMIFLGFSDDVLDLKWRYKLILPTIASFPLLFAYLGSTSILIPKFLHNYFGQVLNLGIIFKLYMSLLAVFCTNSINIYAGINGLEVGQSLIIGVSIVFYNLIEIIHGNIEHSLFSLTIVLPFVFTSLALFWYNKFPAKCFIGDTYCYFAGMTFACAGILGHFSKTLLLFFIPQILNFLISLPQLFGFIKCPRHRLPKYNSKTKLLAGQNINWNLLNVALRLLGPQREQDICNYLLIFQVICSGLALFIRYYIMDILF